MSRTERYYIEAMASCRHYSNCRLTVRVLSVAQALVVLTGAAYFILQKQFFPAFCIAVFGLTFTITLLALHFGYECHFKTYLKYLLDYEKDCGDSEEGPATCFVKRRDLLLRSRWRRVLIIHQPYSLFVFVFFVLSIYTLSQLL